MDTSTFFQNRLMIYEAKQVRLDTWLFEKSPSNSRPLTSKLRRVKDEFEKKKQEAITKATKEQTEIEEMKLQCLRDDHVCHITYLTKIKMEVIDRLID